MPAGPRLMESVTFPIDPASVYVFSGHVHGQASTSLARGYALAPDPQSVIDTMHRAGFTVIALLSLDELREMIAMMGTIEEGDPEAVDQGDLIVSDAMAGERQPSGRLPFPLGEERVFTFTGRPRPNTSLWTGFVVAHSPEDVRRYLATFGFRAEAVASLRDLRELERTLDDVAQGRGEETACLDLLTETALAA